METAVALVSCLVWRERMDGAGAVRPELQGPLAALREAARRIGKVHPKPKKLCSRARSLQWARLPAALARCIQNP